MQTTDQSTLSSHHRGTFDSQLTNKASPLSLLNSFFIKLIHLTLATQTSLHCSLFLKEAPSTYVNTSKIPPFPWTIIYSFFRYWSSPYLLLSRTPLYLFSVTLHPKKYFITFQDGTYVWGPPCSSSLSFPFPLHTSLNPSQHQLKLLPLQ